MLKHNQYILIITMCTLVLRVRSAAGVVRQKCHQITSKFQKCCPRNKGVHHQYCTYGTKRIKSLACGCYILPQSKCLCTQRQCVRIWACSGSRRCTCVTAVPVEQDLSMKNNTKTARLPFIKNSIRSHILYCNG